MARHQSRMNGVVGWVEPNGTKHMFNKIHKPTEGRRMARHFSEYLAEQVERFRSGDWDKEFDGCLFPEVAQYA